MNSGRSLLESYFDWMQIVFPDFYKHGIFMGVGGSVYCEQTNYHASCSNKIIIWKGNFLPGITSIFLIA